MKQTAKALVYLLALALSLAPMLLMVALPLLLVTKARKLIQHEEKKKKPTQQCKTVLVTGAPHTKVCKGSFQKLLSGFFPLRGYPPTPYPLNGKSFCQKTLCGKGGYPPSPLTKNCRKFSSKNGSKGLK